MPWESKNVMSLKEDFLNQAINEKNNISQLCRKFNISRPTAYKWIKRFKEEGALGLNDRSKCPLSSPKRIKEDWIEIILSIRDQYPAWGARKLKQVLINLGHKNLPSESSFNRILQRHERICNEASTKRKKYIRFERSQPNELWQMDFKGNFNLIEGKCYPLTILDDYSRYAICLQACALENTISVRKGLEIAFNTYGLPESMTMDNGSPWKGYPSQRLSYLTVWLMRLGIKVGHSRPYHPQTQGKDERFHRSFKEEVLKYHNFQNLIDAQKHFDEWREIYNTLRPHEAIGMLCPEQRYKCSPRKYPEKLPEIEYEKSDEIRRVLNGGEISFKGKHYYVGEHLKGEPVALRQRTEKKWDIYYVKTRIGGLEQKV